jgi:hypothetical protein
MQASSPSQPALDDRRIAEPETVLLDPALLRRTRGHIRHRLSRRGNRRLNHAIHIAAVTQVRHAHSEGRAYFDRKLAEGKTKKEALRALKRQVSNAVYRQLVVDAAR